MLRRHRRPKVSAADLDESREAAVQFVFRGSLLSALGSTLLVGANQLAAPDIWATALGISGLLAIGAGLMIVGRAGRHLRKYGRTGAEHFLTATAGLGLSVVGWLVPQMLRMLGGPVWLEWASLAGSMGAVVFTGILAILVLRVVVASTGAAARSTQPQERAL